MDKLKKELFRLEDAIKADILKSSRFTGADLDLTRYFRKIAEDAVKKKQLSEDLVFPLTQELMADPETRLRILEDLERVLVKPPECKHPKQKCGTCISIAKAIGFTIPCVRFTPNIGELIDEAKREIAINALEKLLKGENISEKEREHIDFFIKLEKADLHAGLIMSDYGELKAMMIMEKPEKVEKWLEESLKRTSKAGAKHRVRAVGEIASAIVLDVMNERFKPKAKEIEVKKGTKKERKDR